MVWTVMNTIMFLNYEKREIFWLWILEKVPTMIPEDMTRLGESVWLILHFIYKVYEFERAYFLFQ